ncbi:hypothetical protein [Dokdonella koreensis]|uniref:Uncharacterized protein n=1 Tax=Dokdonella koreensis DS-123 TaxID=1300342 RepID=A0A167G239_9GAMM|nr:hypothetical protein [Dokdonella koreensis]ANB16071.1 Hypothetical protein I596_31 [Dokdonella koreensis DS-123]
MSLRSPFSIRPACLSLGLVLAACVAPVYAGSLPFGLGSVAGGESGIEAARPSRSSTETDTAGGESGSSGYFRNVGSVSAGATPPALPAAAPAPVEEADADDLVRPAPPVRPTLPAAAAPAGERKTGHRWQSLVPGAIK